MSIAVVSTQLNGFNYCYRLFGLVVRVFANGPGDLGSIYKTIKMVLDTALLNTQQYKVHIKGKVEQSRERSSALPYSLVWYLSKREPAGRPWLKGDNFYWLIPVYLSVYFFWIKFNILFLQDCISFQLVSFWLVERMFTFNFA